MGKPRLTREARRETILDAATEVFGRLGFEATRMEDVASAAGIAKGLLYKHFSSKDALFQALIDRQGQAYAAELRGALAGSDLDADPLGNLREGLAFWLRKVGDEAATFNVTDPGVHDAMPACATPCVRSSPTPSGSPSHGCPSPIPGWSLPSSKGQPRALGWSGGDEPSAVGADDVWGLLTAFCWGGLMELARGDSAAGAPVSGAG